MQELGCLSGKDASLIKAWGFTSKTGTVKLIPACHLIVSCCFYIFRGLCSAVWTYTTLPCLACRSFYQAPQHRLIAEHSADACAEQALAWLVWPRTSMSHCWAPLGWVWRLYHSSGPQPFAYLCPWWLWAWLAPAQPGTCWFRWTFTVQAECGLALAFWQAIFSYCLLPFILNLCFGMPVGCQIPLNTPLRIRNVFIKRTGCLAASELSILFLCSCWASLSFQASETMERCCRKTCKVPCDGLSLQKCCFWGANNTQWSHFCSWSYMGVLISLGTTGTPSNCSFKSSPVALLCNKVHVTDIRTAYTRWKCFSFFGKVLVTVIWVPWWQVISACARAPWLQHCHLGVCYLNSAVALTSQAGQLGALTQGDLWTENAWMHCCLDCLKSILWTSTFSIINIFFLLEALP